MEAGKKPKNMAFHMLLMLFIWGVYFFVLFFLVCIIVLNCHLCVCFRVKRVKAVVKNKSCTTLR